MRRLSIFALSALLALAGAYAAETLTYGGITIEVSERGAELSRVYDSATGTEYLWLGDPAFWGGHDTVLWPFVGRLQDGKYTYNGETYSLKMHGFASSSDFELVERTESSLSFQITSNEETLKSYPFEFVFTVRYSIEGNSVIEELIVENTGDGPLVYGIGGHPGFNVPLEEGLEFTDYCIEFPDSGEIKRCLFAGTPLMSGIEEETDTVTDGRMDLRHDLFLDDAVVLSGTGGRAVLRSAKGERAVEVSYPGARWVGVWQMPKPDAPFVCIEPWWTLPGPSGEILDFGTAEDLCRVPEGGTASHRIMLTLL